MLTSSQQKYYLKKSTDHTNKRRYKLTGLPQHVGRVLNWKISVEMIT